MICLIVIILRNDETIAAQSFVIEEKCHIRPTTESTGEEENKKQKSAAEVTLHTTQQAYTQYIFKVL